MRAGRQLLAQTRFALTATEITLLEVLPDIKELRRCCGYYQSVKPRPGTRSAKDSSVPGMLGFYSSGLNAVLQDFWLTGNLAVGIKDDIIEFIPKKLDKWFVKECCPLTMLNMIYKIIAKILALRLKRIVPKLINPLVNPQQTEFIPGRNILENVSLGLLTCD